MAAPLVSVVVPAFNLARYLPAALDSALTQADPGGPIEVIVVDDGSTDETPEVLAGYADRVRAIRQPNAGLTAAVDRGLHEVRGEFVALLDADDTWPRDRLARHVGILRARPTLGLVHGDMEVTDAHGTVTERSFMSRQPLAPVDGRALGALLGRNFVSGGATTFRAVLLPAILPMGAETAYPDWRIGACVAAVSEIHFDPASANRYRSHGANMSLGSDRAAQLKIQRGELPWRRWMMAHLAADESVSTEDVRAALGAWRWGITVAAAGFDGPVRDLLLAPPAEIAPLPAGTPHSRELLRRFAADPFDGALAIELEVALMREASASPPGPPLITLTTRSRVTLVSLADSLARPELLGAYARRTLGSDEDTLLVLAPARADLRPLVALVDGDELLGAEDCDIQVINEPVTTPARRLLAARAHALLGSLRTSSMNGGIESDGGVEDPYAGLEIHSAALDLIAEIA
jgi:hypothetical protein